jgi:hypothetical protein
VVALIHSIAVCSKLFHPATPAIHPSAYYAAHPERSFVLKHENTGGNSVDSAAFVRPTKITVDIVWLYGAR